MNLLPETKTEMKKELKDQITLMYGVPKSGKTTFAAQYPDVLFLATESGQNAHRVYKVAVDSWVKFLAVLKELSLDKSKKFKNICIDTIDNLFDFCAEFALAEAGYKHGSDNDNAGYSAIGAEFQRALKKMTLLDYGIVMISHQRDNKIKSKSDEYIKHGPNLTGKNSKFLLGLSDLILYFQIEEEKNAETNEVKEARKIRTIASKYYEAGGRWAMKDPIEMNFSAFKKEYDKSTGGK